MPSFNIPTIQQQAVAVNKPGFASVPRGIPNVRAEAVGKQFYRDGRTDNDYQEDLGIRILPSSGPVGTPPRIVRVHGGFAVRIVRWTAERVGAWPLPPSASTGDPGQVLMWRSRRPLSPLMGPNGQKIYRVAGTYIFALADVLTETDRLNVGTLGWSADPPEYLEGIYDSIQLQGVVGTATPAVPNIKDLLGSK